MNDVKCQVLNIKMEVLIDKSATGKDRDWKGKKINTLKLAEIYKAIDFKKSERLENCSTALQFVGCENKVKLIRANFCRVRLCSICQWRRAMKVYAQVSKIMETMKKDGYTYVLLTLTMRNCMPEELGETVTEMMAAWNKFSQQKLFKNTVQGYYRAMEITRNKHDGTFNPHFHVILAMPASYFSKGYINQKKWAEMWGNALNVDYTPVVNVKRVKGETAKAVAEIAKYAVKDSDYIISKNYDLSVEIVAALDKALDKRRFVSFGGVFAQYHKLLNLDDVEDGDLVGTNGDETSNENLEEISYIWFSGYSNYYHVH